MKKKICYVVEDNREDRASLLSYIEKTPFLNLSGTSATYEAAVEFLLSHTVDILYLDIELSDGLTGMDLIRTIPRLPQLIVTSNHSAYAVDSYKLGKITDFLLKPFNYERFLLATNRAISGALSAPPARLDSSVFLKTGRRFQKVDLNDVLWFESFGIYVKVITHLLKHQELVVNETISSITRYLDSRTFIRIHKLYIININKITGFDANTIFVSGKPLPIVISYKAKLESLFKLLMNLDEDS